MRLHPNAKLTPVNRLLLVERIRRQGWKVTEAAEAAGVSRRTAYKWLRRFDTEGKAGLEDRSSRPHRIARRTPRRLTRRIEQLRRRRKAGWEIAQELGIPVSTVSRHLQRAGLGRLWRLDEQSDPPRRYEHRFPGQLLHVDAKRFARIEAIGHRIHGDRSRKRRGVGWEVVFVCVDDCTRLAYAEVWPAEDAVCATRFFRRAVRWFQSLGIRPRRRAQRQRQVLRLQAVHPAMPRARHRAELHAALHAPDQRQSGALHPDTQAALGLSSPLPHLSDPSGLAACLGQALQSPPTPPSPRKANPDGPAQRDP